MNTPVEKLITRDREIVSGTPVFTGTRVPVRTLFDYLADGKPLEYFLEQYPDVTHDQAVEAIELARQTLLPDDER